MKPGGEITKVQARTITVLEQCDNCGRPIGKLETPHLWQSSVVCPECHGRLTRQTTAHLAVPNAPALPMPAPAAYPVPAPAPAPIRPVIIHTPAPTVNILNHNTQMVSVGVQRRGCLGTIVRAIFLLVVIVVATVAICLLWAALSAGMR